MDRMMLLKLFPILLLIHHCMSEIVKRAAINSQINLNPIIPPVIKSDEIKIKQPRAREHVVLAEHPDCKDEIHRICSHTALKNNFATLICLQNDQPDEGVRLSEKCHHLIWTVKKNLTSDNRFREAALSVCRNELAELKECNIHDIRKPMDSEHNGHLLSCLIDHVGENGSPDCRNFLTQMEVLIFSDYRLIYKFEKSCHTDIQRLQCGRLSTKFESERQSTTQGSTIQCLQKDIGSLDDQCKQEILRISELQSDDFHLDRALFFACRDDRERFCAKITAGEGRVYQCLMQHRDEREMSKGCHDKLIEREKLVVNDYKVSKKLAKVCRNDIRIYKCRGDANSKRQVKLSRILLCLENKLEQGYPIDGDCRAEMFEHRRALLEDYHLTPDLVINCEKEIETFCGKTETGGKTLHCLMKHSKSRRTGNMEGGNTGRISDKCLRTLEDLLKEVNIAEDWRVDPVLRSACESAVQTLCSNWHPGDGRVLSCLMDHIESPKLGSDCKANMLQIQYFVARDFNLDASLYKVCRNNAINLCHAKKDWNSDFDDLDPDRGPTVLACLYRYAYHPDNTMKLNPNCRNEVRRVMRQRAMSVELHPEIEEPCLYELSLFCSGDSEDIVQRGYEIECLQDNYQSLGGQCKTAIANYTAEESRTIELNYPLFNACSEPLKQLCNDELDQDVDEGDLLECLILNKNNRIIKHDHHKCLIAIEHFQILSLKDIKFNFKFKEACKNEVLTHCREVKNKYDVVACLSTIVFNDTISDAAVKRISRKCEKQLKFELLQQSENIKLDPKLYDACEQDRVEFCSHISPGRGNVYECLITHKEGLSSKCHILLFKREKIQMKDNSIDYNLINTCKSSIRKFCPDYQEYNEVLYCLREYRNKPEMNKDCRKIVMRRLAEQNTDYRLNPRLKKGCQRDIQKFCYNILATANQNQELDGQIIDCLKRHYIKNRLSQSCEIEVVSLIREVGENYELDPKLVKVCDHDIQLQCSSETDVQECLKSKFLEKKISDKKCKDSIAILISEEHADIKSDPLLYKACIADIKRYCMDITSGHGKQLSCLMAVHEAKASMTQECEVVLSNRVSMFEYAAEVAPVESIQELYSMIRTSPSRNYFLMVAMMAICFLFMGGLCCGRVTKRVPISMKNK